MARPQRTLSTEALAAACPLPRESYTDPRVFEAEKEAIFFKQWQFVGHTSEFKEVGSYVTRQIVDQSVVVTRAEDGQLHGFYNVCPHRGHELLTGCGSVNQIVCPYHSWTFRPDGSLRVIPGERSVCAIDKQRFSLSRVRVEVFCHFVFVNLDPQASPLASQAGDLAALMQEIFPHLEELEPFELHETEMRCNWKVNVDNFQECYHCSKVHQTFCSLIDYSSYRTRSQGIFTRHHAPITRQRSTAAIRIAADVPPKGHEFIYLWPNMTFNLYAGSAVVGMMNFEPRAVDRTVMWIKDYSVRRFQIDEEYVKAYQKAGLTTASEDIAICESVQRGMSSRGYVARSGSYVHDADRTQLSEHAVEEFHRRVRLALGANLVPGGNDD